MLHPIEAYPSRLSCVKLSKDAHPVDRASGVQMVMHEPLCALMPQAETAQGARALQIADSRIAELEMRLTDAMAGSFYSSGATHL